VAAVAQHGDRIRQPKDLPQAMADVEERRPAPAQAVEESKEARRLVLCQGARRLVQDQQPRLAGQGARDLDELPLGDTQALEEACRRERQLQALQDRRHSPVHLSMVDPAAPRRLAPQEETLLHSEIGRQLDLLVDDVDPQPARVVRASDRERDAVQQQAAGIRRMHADEDLHQRALARPVLTDDSVDLARTDGETDVLQGPDAGEPLRDSIDRQQRRGSRRRE
jgi:hypothetical protein